MTSNLPVIFVLTGVKTNLVRKADLLGENPGIGGTHWVTLQIAARIAARAAYPVHIVLVGSGGNEWVQQNLVIQQVSKLRQAVPAAGTVAITPASVARHMGGEWSRSELIVVLHHPHVGRLELSPGVQPRAFVSVGQYAWHSNKSVNSAVKHVWIPNPFPTWAIRNQQDMSKQANSPPTFGYVGALVPAKGFHLVARAWRQICESDVLPGAKLEVIGAKSLYGLGDEHGVVPTSWEYGNRILMELGDSADTVSFLGRIGQGKLAKFSRWTAGFGNPTGASEADPSSAKELIAAGVPLVAAADFGMWDMMRFFPQFVARRPGNISRLGVQAAIDPSLRTAFFRSRRVALRHSLAVDRQLEVLWMELIGSLYSRQLQHAGIVGSFPKADTPTGLIGLRLSVRRRASDIVMSLNPRVQQRVRQIVQTIRAVGASHRRLQ